VFKSYRWLRDASRSITLTSFALLNLFVVTIASTVVVPNAVVQQSQNIQASEPGENLVEISEGLVTWGPLKIGGNMSVQTT